METDRPDDEAYDPRDHDVEPVEPTTEAEAEEASAAYDAPAEPKGRWLLGTLAGVGVMLAGVAVWSLLYRTLERDYVGVTVVFALVIGYVVREVTRRATVAARLLAAFLTALLCVLGSLVAPVAYAVKLDPRFGFFETLGEVLKQPFEVLGRHQAVTWGIFVAAVVVAFLSAAPPRPKQPRKRAATTRADDDETTASEPGF